MLIIIICCATYLHNAKAGDFVRSRLASVIEKQAQTFTLTRNNSSAKLLIFRLSGNRQSGNRHVFRAKTDKKPLKRYKKEADKNRGGIRPERSLPSTGCWLIINAARKAAVSELRRAGRRSRWGRRRRWDSARAAGERQTAGEPQPADIRRRQPCLRAACLPAEPCSPGRGTR